MARRGWEGTTGEDTVPLKPKLRIKITVHKREKKLYVIRYLEVVDGGGLKGDWRGRAEWGEGG